MRLCIPSETKDGLESQVGYHFGRVPLYTIYDDETQDVIIIKNTSTHMGGNKLPAELLYEHNIDVMLCGGLGRRAIQLFEQYGVEVFVGAYGTVKDAIRQFKDKKLQMATDKTACQEHKYRGEGGHEELGHHH
ncbi:MAG: NifB/NifX family molybdenum-iron cluster-binding protein [Candidatus Heimdallarchaeota archaeon]|nr:MAG: NifB/NifX family molybdenum-iron cluster-binding protein [Candidatus Heimdallarchaeota archaeon]